MLLFNMFPQPLCSSALVVIRQNAVALGSFVPAWRARCARPPMRIATRGGPTFCRDSAGFEPPAAVPLRRCDDPWLGGPCARDALVAHCTTRWPRVFAMGLLAAPRGLFFFPRVVARWTLLDPLPALVAYASNSMVRVLVNLLNSG